MLEGVKVVEVSMWAFVPSAGAVLSDWGADVVKIEPPTGDPIRGLVNAGVGATEGLAFPWEIWNRGKKGIALDLNQEAAQEIVLKLVEEADVFLTSYLPPTRRKLGIDIDAIRARNPSIIYASGSGQGASGPEADKGGYDSISFWSRGSVSASVTPPDYPRPVPMPAGAFGDSLSGMALAGGIAAALAKRFRTGEGTIVDGSLLGTAMWCMQMGIVGGVVAAASGAAPALAPQGRVYNPLVYNYKTSDDRWLALCMLQPDRYYEGLVRAIGREDMVADDRFATPAARAEHSEDIVKELERTFASKTVDEWRKILSTQPGQWDVVNRAIDMPEDPQAQINGFIQDVHYSGNRVLPMVSSPVLFDRTPFGLKPAPEFSGNTDEVLESIGMDAEAILEAKIAGAVI
jgi:crotonobetainyl-CoA:carnitine CoA-transferase CaiB-like acyl-CoA transferase